MNFHIDEWIMDRVQEHYNEAIESFPEEQIVLIALQGSQNYQLSTSNSDIDTKLIVVPTFKDIAMNKDPISTTHVRANNEHTDWKDIRLYCNCFAKMNINFLEILFTKYKIINPIYSEQWQRLIDAREDIAHYHPARAIQTMYGMAHNKFKNMEHMSPAAQPYIEKFNYVPKELHHLLRLQEFMERYISGETYERCLIPDISEYLKYIKAGNLSLDQARMVAKDAILNIDIMHNNFLEQEHTVNKSVKELLDDVQYNIMKIAIQMEFEKGVK